MKKLIILITFAITILLFSNQYRIANYNKAYIVYNYQDYISKILGEEQCPMEFEFNSYEDGVKIIDVINEFVEQSNECYLVHYHETNSQKGDLFKKIIYSKDNNILSNLFVITDNHIDFSNIKDENYYSTDDSDQKSSGYIRVLDRHWFQKFRNTYQFETSYRLKEYLKSDLKLYYYFFDNNHEEFYEKLVSFIKSSEPDIHFTIYDYTEGYQESLITQLEDDMLQECEDILRVLCVLYIISLIIIINHNKKKYLISRIQGISVCRLIKKEVLPIILCSSLVFLLVQIVLLIKHIDIYNEMCIEFLLGLLITFGYYLISNFIVILFVYLYISKISHITLLKKNTTKEMIYFYTTIKICIIILMISPLYFSFKESIPTTIRYIEILKNESNLKDYVQIIPLEINDEIFSYMNNNGEYVNFENHMFMYKDFVYDSWSDMEKEEIDQFKLNYPMIFANQKYLNNYQIKDLNGNILDLSTYEDDVLLVPKKYEHDEKELEKYKHGTSKVIIIKDNKSFYDLSMQNKVVKVNNPIIHVVNSNNSYFNSRYIFFSLKKQTLEQYYDEVYKLMGYEGFEIYDRENLIDIYKMDSEYEMKNALAINISYLFVFLSIIYLYLSIFIDINSKEIMIQYILGFHFMKIIKRLILLNSVTYLISFVIALKLLSLDLLTIFFITMFIYIFELIIDIVAIKYLIRKRGINILKGNK